MIASASESCPPAGEWRQSLSASGLLLIAAAILLLPALVNRSPFLYYDSGEYLRLGRAIFAGLKDYQHNDLWLTFLGGRSVTYSLFLVATIKAGTIWLPAIVQALVGAYVLAAVVRVAMIERRTLAYLGLAGALASMTQAGFFAAYLMPDVFAAYALLIIFVLVVSAGTLRRRTVIILWLLLVFSTSAHATNVVIAVLATLAGLFGKVVIGKAPLRIGMRSVGGIAAALFAAVLIAVACSTAIRIGAGEPLRKPPYLMARVLADGPGRSYVRNDCSTARFAICRYRNKPLTNSDAILWSPDPAVSVLYTADHRERVDLSDQELAFVTQAVLRYPGEQLAASARNAARQFVLVNASNEMSQSAEVVDQSVGSGIPNSVAIVRAGLDYRHLLNWRLFDLLHQAGLAVAVIAGLRRLAQRDFQQAWSRGATARSPGDDARVVALVAVGALITILIANAVICGTLSGPSARYQARLIWLVPAACFLVYARFGWKPATPDPILSV